MSAVDVRVEPAAGPARDRDHRALAEAILLSLIALTVARELNRLTIRDALRLVALVQSRSPGRRDRTAARLARGLIKKDRQLPAEHEVLALEALRGLRVRGPQRVIRDLAAMIDRASSQPRRRPVAW